MIRHISIANFKAFGRIQEVPLRPLTLIFGQNSGGKSSIIHSLLLAHHAEQRDTWHIGSPVLAGDSIDLGGFHNYVHRQDSKRSLQLAISCDIPPYCQKHPLLKTTSQVRTELQVGASGNEWRDNDVERRLPFLQSCAVQIDSRALLKLEQNDNHRLEARLQTDHPAVAKFVAHCTGHFQHPRAAAIILEEFESICSSADLGAPTFFPGRVSFTHDLDELFAEPATNPPELSPEQQVVAWARANLPNMLASLFANLQRCFADNLGQLEYLGPLRTMPDRFMAETDDADPNWKSGGTFAWQHLKEDKDLLVALNATLEQMEVPYFIQVRRLADEDSIQKAIVEYLHGRAEPRLLQSLADQQISPAEELKLSDSDYRAYLLANPELKDELAKCWQEQVAETSPDYSMDEAVRDVLNTRMDREMPEAWSELILEYPEGNPRILAIQMQLGIYDPKEKTDDDPQADGIRSDIIAKLTDRRTDLKLVDSRTETAVSPRDVGIGISQMVPVLVHALASRGKLIAIEQPEIHLHPALQTKLGDVFIESALGPNRNQFLIETHSEHLILRVMRRIRETARNSLPEGKPAIRPDDVAVLYVQPGENGSTVQELRIDEQGRFVDNWPQGFFEERLDEMF